MIISKALGSGIMRNVHNGLIAVRNWIGDKKHRKIGVQFKLLAIFLLVDVGQYGLTFFGRINGFFGVRVSA